MGAGREPASRIGCRLRPRRSRLVMTPGAPRRSLSSVLLSAPIRRTPTAMHRAYAPAEPSPPRPPDDETAEDRSSPLCASRAAVSRLSSRRRPSGAHAVTLATECAGASLIRLRVPSVRFPPKAAAPPPSARHTVSEQMDIRRHRWSSETACAEQVARVLCGRVGDAENRREYSDASPEPRGAEGPQSALA